MKTNNGGPAFPNAGGQKFLHGGEIRKEMPSSGMTLRDYFAALAMQAIRSKSALLIDSSVVAAMAYEQADEMLQERNT